MGREELWKGHGERGMGAWAVRGIRRWRVWGGAVGGTWGEGHGVWGRGCGRGMGREELWKGHGERGMRACAVRGARRWRVWGGAVGGTWGEGHGVWGRGCGRGMGREELWKGHGERGMRACAVRGARRGRAWGGAVGGTWGEGHGVWGRGCGRGMGKGAVGGAWGGRDM